MNLWADQAQREKIDLCGELEMRSRLYQESHTSNQESKRKRKPTLRGKWGNAISGRQLDSVRKETPVVSVRDPVSGNRCEA